MKLKPLLALLLAGCVTAPAENRVHSPPSPSEVRAEACAPLGGWVDDRGRSLDATHVINDAAKAPVVLLGEAHDNAEHHRWQLKTLIEVHAVNPHVAIAMEMFPRRLQPILDQWVAGGLTEAAFLRAVDWDRVWGFDAAFYMPILHFARATRSPVVAMNVERSLVARVGREGWAAIPVGEREDVGDPAPVTDAYRQRLSAVMGSHGADQRQSRGIARFIEAQSLWDRAMAQAMAETHLRTGRLVVGILGRGHVQHGDGVPHQLAALGVTGAVSLLPWDPHDDCAMLRAGGLADALFAVPPVDQPQPPKLGVALTLTDSGVKVDAVAAGSVGKRAGLRQGDIITAAAGRPVIEPGDLIAIIRRQPPGSWMPLDVRRAGVKRLVVAKFPVE